MEKASEKTSTWLALRNPVFRRLWSAMVVSGSCIGAHNTAVYWALNSLGGSTVLISLMATVSALPATLFTLPAAALGGMQASQKGFFCAPRFAACAPVRAALPLPAALLDRFLELP